MDINDLVLTDKAYDAINNGTWIDAGEGYPDLKFLVVGFSSETARNAMREKGESMRKAKGGKYLDDHELEQCYREVLVETVLRDWSGLTNNGEPVAYDKELARKWLLSRQGERLRAAILAAVNKLDENANALVEQIEKNS